MVQDEMYASEDDKTSSSGDGKKNPKQEQFANNETRKKLPEDLNEAGGIGEVVFPVEGDAVMQESDIELQAKIETYIDNFREINKPISHGVLKYNFNVAVFPNGVMLDLEVKDSDVEMSTFHDVTDFPSAVNALNFQISDILNTEDQEELKNFLKKNEVPNKQGSNIYVGGGHTYIIKGKDETFWSKNVAENDANNILKYKSKMLKKLSKEL